MLRLYESRNESWGRVVSYLPEHHRCVTAHTQSHSKDCETYELLAVKGQNDKLDFILIEHFSSEENEKQGTNQKKIFANHLDDKGFVSRIYKRPVKLSKKTNRIVYCHEI